jgi:hypothetical protein
MADDTYRQDRKKINPADLAADPDEGGQQNAADQLQEMARFRQMAAQEVGREHAEPTLKNPMAGEGVPAVKVQGKIPPQFAEMLARQGVNPGSLTGQQRAPSKMARPQDEQFVVQHGGSQHFKDLIDGLKDKSQMYETVELPSRGVFYDGTDGPTDGMLHIRPMTGEEEQILATPRFVKKGQAINMIFQRCMRDKYRPEEFLTVDRTYLLIYLRGISYTPEYDVEVKCPECDRKFSHTIDLNRLNVDECPQDYGPALEDVLPTSQYVFHYRLSRGPGRAAHPGVS